MIGKNSKEPIKQPMTSSVQTERPGHRKNSGFYNRFASKCLVTVLFFLLPAAAASCDRMKDSSPAAGGDAKQSALSDTADMTVSESAVGEAPATPAASPAPSSPPGIVFTNPEDQTNTYKENLYLDANETTIFIMSGGNEPLSFTGKAINIDNYLNRLGRMIGGVEYAMDGSALAILVDINQYGSGRLVYSDGTSITEIASDVDTFHLSADGSAVLYLTTPKYEQGIGGDLYYFDCSTGKSTSIATGAGRLFAISPCGDSVSYTTFYETGDPDALSCYSLVIGETPAVIDTDSYCAAISDDAETVYYLKKSSEGESLYVNCSGISKPLSLLYPSDDYTKHETFFFNYDQTQIVFNSGRSAYFFMPGCDPYRLSSSPIIYFIGKSMYSDIPDYLYKSVSDDAGSGITISVYGTKNLCNVPFDTDDNTAIVFDENMKISEDTNPDYPPRFIFNGDTFVTATDDGICTIYQNNEEEGAVTLPGIYYPTITENKSFYYVSSLEYKNANIHDNIFCGNLYMVNDSLDPSKAEPIASNVYDLKLFEKEGTDILYYLAWPEENSEDRPHDYYINPYLNLYALEDTPGAKPVLVAENVCTFEAGSFGVIYWKLNDAKEPMILPYTIDVDVYTSKDGISFRKIMERPFTHEYVGP